MNAAEKTKSLRLDCLQTEDQTTITAVSNLRSRNANIEDVVVELLNKNDVGRIIEAGVAANLRS